MAGNSRESRSRGTIKKGLEDKKSSYNVEIIFVAQDEINMVVHVLNKWDNLLKSKVTTVGMNVIRNRDHINPNCLCVIPE